MLVLVLVCLPCLYLLVYFSNSAALTKKSFIYTMLVLFHALLCAIKELSSPFWLNDIRVITSQAVEAICDAARDH